MLRTDNKLKIARVLNRLVVAARSVAGKGPDLEAVRDGIRWQLDLNEGIDLAIYLKLYQKIPQRLLDTWIAPGSLAVDIGANVGAHCLPLARHVGPTGCVVAVEPTDFAFGKLKKNIALNPELTSRVIPIQAALTDGGSGSANQTEFYSRWPLRTEGAKLHREHLGQMETASASRLLPLDTLIDELRAQGRIGMRVAFVKLDVDGNELSVLRSGPRLFTTDRPAVLVEMAPYVQDEQAGRLEALLDTLSSYGYRLEYADTGREFPMSADLVRREIVHGAALDLLARIG